MTISANVRKELFEMSANEGKLIRIKPTEAKAGTTVYSSKQAQPLKMWTQEEHEKFLEAMEKYPAGPWKVIAAFIGTKTTRQTMTHAQKYRQKIGRWRRGLRHKGRKQQADEAAASEAESAKDSLFKAIEYVSSDETSHYGGDGSSPARSVAGSVDGGSGGSGGPSELFRLAELASIEGMKQEPPQQQQQLPSMPVPPMPVPMSVTPSSPADVEMDDVSAAARIQIKQESGDQYMYKLKQQQMEWGYGYPHGHGTNHHEIRLSPLRGTEHHAPSRRVLSAISGLSFMNAQHAPPLPLPASYGLHPRSPSVVGSPERDMSDDDEFRRPFRLPPLNIAAQGTSAFAIPPLRSKIDPSVLGGRPQFA